MKIVQLLVVCFALCNQLRAQDPAVIPAIPPIPPPVDVSLDFFPITLFWDTSLDPSVTGYFVHYGTNSGTYTTRLAVINTNQVTLSLEWLEGQTYFMAMTATNVLGESPFSNEVNYSMVSPPPLTNVIVTVSVTMTLTNPPGNKFFMLFSKTNMVGPWSPEAPVTITAERF